MATLDQPTDRSKAKATTAVLKYEPDGVAAQSYRQLAQEVLTHGQR